MDNNSCAKRTTRETTKKTCDWYQSLSKEEKEKSINVVVSNIKTFLNMNMRTLLVEYKKKYYKICKGFMQKFFKPLSKCFLILTGSQICLGYQKLLFCKIIFSSSFFGKDSFSNNFLSSFPASFSLFNILYSFYCSCSYFFTLFCHFEKTFLCL